MSSAFADLIQQPTELVENALRKIEDLNGNPSEDARVLAENQQKLRAKIQDLGLDPDDTTGEELYQALRAKLAADSAQIDRALGVNQDTPVSERVDKAIGLVSQDSYLPQMWLLKHASAKKLLSGQPPAKLMKTLKYRSLQSFIKHENAELSYLLAGATESKTWQAKLAKSVSHLSPADYEMRQLSIIALDPKHWLDNRISSRTISNKQVGLVAINPASLPKDADVLPLSIVLIKKIENLSTSSLSYRIGELNPVLRWWSDTQGLICRNPDGPVSLNIKDLAKDHLLGRDYQKRSTKQAAQQLLDNLAERYENQSERVSEAFRSLGYNLEGTGYGSSDPLGQRLALEYAEAE